MPTKNILFITGAFVSNSCWDDWRLYFESRGYSTSAPAWPFKNGSAEDLRNRQPRDTDLALLTLDELVTHYANIAKAYSTKPIIIGHSLGGMITQILCNRDLATAAVAIHSVPTLGVFPYEFSFLKAGWRSLGLFTSVKKTYLMSFKTFQYAFVNNMPRSEQEEAYQKYVIPESKTVARGGLTRAAAVDYHKPHPPLLMTSGSLDHIIPPHLNHRNFKKYKQNGSVLEYKEFEGRNHHVLAQPGWEGDAEYVYNWISRY